MRIKAIPALVLVAWATAGCAGTRCPTPGEPIQWIADYCMLELETDDEIAASGCIERKRKARFTSACASNAHFKKRMCELMVKSGTRAGTVHECVRDPAFKGRTVEAGGVGR